MVTAIIVLICVALAVAISIIRPTGNFPAPTVVDRDRERVLADLRALPDYRCDVRLP
ncbi:hypothetical protein [Pseudonocardia sp.]|jgi:hypothetical protein|uniref:hypothetical protein n=1 Tax=Pseudonocardia sp. TaxID=60912 RepID=UPI0028CAC89F|nr:hypothetical protein [Pseudonocardia sp.]MDT7649671.1 hypothetical protein [Pseudonocardiales bacterium]HET6258991.1 hypothetical protein [Pseudonocardia sp.]